MIRFKQVVSGVLTGFLFCGSAISGAPLIAAAKTETTYSLTLDKTENGSVAIFDAEKEAKKDESKEQQNTEATTKEKALTKKVKAGDTVSIKVKPDAKYIIKKLSLIDPETKKKLDVELFADEKHEDVVTFTMPAQDVMVTSSYEEGKVRQQALLPKVKQQKPESQQRPLQNRLKAVRTQRQQQKLPQRQMQKQKNQKRMLMQVKSRKLQKKLRKRQLPPNRRKRLRKSLRVPKVLKNQRRQMNR